MRLTLKRYAKVGTTILGYIDIPGKSTIMILEDDKEELPAGFYHLVPFSGVRFTDTYAFVGAHASVYPEDGVDRSTCIFHGGDTHEDTRGCPLVGVRFHFDDHTPNIDGGAEAMKMLRLLLVADQTHYVNIIEEYGK
jgi:hypothetical protein